MTLTHQLLAMAARSSAEEGAAVALAGRTRWSATLRVGALDAGGSVTVVLETSPTGEDDTWTALVAFGAQTAVGVTTKSTSATPADFTIPAYHRYLRANVTAQTGSATYEVEASAAFVSATADTALFSKELRTFGDGLARLVDRAEEDVLNALTRAERSAPYTAGPASQAATDNPWRPSLVEWLDLPAREQLADTIDATVLDVDLTLPGVGDVLRTVIVAQAEHLFRRHTLERSDSATAAVTLRDFPPLAPRALERLAPYRPQRASVWRGR